MKISNKIKSAVLGGVMAVSTLASPLAAVSPSLSATAAGAGDDYAKLLQYSIYFYDANMCGDQAEEVSKLSWRGDCHTQDSVNGGYHDAGDHVKFGITIGYSMSVLDWGYYEFGDAYTSTGQAGHLKDVTDYGAKYMRDCTTLSGGSVSNFIYQIGNGDADHGEWCAPEMQGPSSRKVYSTSSGASDIAAGYAAALAAHYVNFKNEDDLTYAKALFEFSTKSNQCATDGPDSFYGPWDYYDKQAFAAGWLYLATKDSKYKTFLDGFMNANGQGKSGQAGCKWGVYSPLSWNNFSMGAAILQAEITNSADDWKKVTTFIDGTGGNSNDYYFEMKWGSARYNTAQQFAALVASKHGAKDYYSWSKGQMDYIMGNKGVGGASPTCFVVALADNSAKNAHHRAASGYASNDEMTGQTGYSSKGHVLVGALVGGPTSQSGEYNDSIQDWTANEVTIDYNAALVGAAAGLYSKYKTGKAVDPSTIPGVEGGSSTVITTQKPDDTTTTTTAGNDTTTTTTTTKPVQQGNDKVVEVSVPSGAKELEIKLNGADAVEVIFDNKGGKMNGAFDCNDNSGKYIQFGSFDTTDSKTTVDVSDIDAQNDTVKLHVWYAEKDGVISKVNLIYKNAEPITTTTTTKATTTTTTTKATTTTATTTTRTTTYPIGGNVVYGDANCDRAVNIGDAVLILQSIASNDKFGVNGSDPNHITDQGIVNADCSNVGDGVTSLDALAIQKSLLGLVTLPV